VARWVDLGDEASVTAMVDAARSPGRPDILHNNAADTRLSGTRDMAVEKVDTCVWDDILRINLRGTMIASRAAIPHLRKRGGAIVNISSNAALAGALSHSAYSASKAASPATQASPQHGGRHPLKPCHHRHAGDAKMSAPASATAAPSVVAAPRTAGGVAAAACSRLTKRRSSPAKYLCRWRIARAPAHARTRDRAKPCRHHRHRAAPERVEASSRSSSCPHALGCRLAKPR
jgi:hypothetical protein